MIIEVVGKEIEKIKGDFESYLNGLNMVGEISYSQYSELYDEGIKQIQKAYELGKSELEKENTELKNKLEALEGQTPWKDIKDKSELIKENAELKADNDVRKFAMTMSEKVEKQLREENAKLKTDYEVLSCSIGDFGELQDKLEEEQRKNNGLSDNLTKAKEIIKKLLHSLKNEGSDYTFALESTHPVLAEAEQFLSEVEK